MGIGERDDRKVHCHDNHVDERNSLDTGCDFGQALVVLSLLRHVRLAIAWEGLQSGTYTFFGYCIPFLEGVSVTAPQVPWSALCKHHK